MPDYTITALGEDVNIFKTCYQGVVDATYEELKSLFVFNVGPSSIDPDDPDNTKVFNEFRAELSITGDDVDPEYWRHNLVATVYDWKQVSPETAKIGSFIIDDEKCIKGMFQWHVGGHHPCVVGYVNDLVKRQREVLKNG
jgi:hypothetical protein